MSRSVTPEAWNIYIGLRLGGVPRSAACAKANISYTTAAKFDRGSPESSGYDLWLQQCKGEQPFLDEARRYAQHGLSRTDVRLEAIEDAVLRTVRVGPRCVEAAMALEDFNLFRPRYMGRLASPMQVKAAETIVEMLQDCNERFAVFNTPPGWGKSTLLHDVEAWMTARWRGIRGINGSRGEKLAIQNTARLKRTLERTTPLTGAVAAMSADFGMFQPDKRDRWRDAEFIVYQTDGAPIEEKEPTWQSLGMDSTQLGNRGNFISWDDLVDPRKDLRTPEAIQAQRDFVDDTAETRLEPSGLFLITMQRLGADDISRYCLDMRLPVDDLDLVDTGADDPRPRKYTHICFQAHDEANCQGDHGADARPQPYGCLLDPKRLPWRKLRGIMEHREQKYRVQYQQEDVDPASVLVQRSWLVYDKDRGLWSVPPGDGGVSYISVDPSGSKYWAIQAWHYIPDGDDGLGGRRYLMDLWDRPMEAPDLLDRDYNSLAHTGVLEDWRRNFREIRRPLRAVVVEINAAQRYLLQFPHAQRWAEKHGIHFLKHTTGINKTDPDLGIWSHQQNWRFGRVILPGRTPLDVVASKPLTDQVCRYPGSARDDQVMAWWMSENKMRDLVAIRESLPMLQLRESRPDWMRNPSLLVGAR